MIAAALLGLLACKDRPPDDTAPPDEHACEQAAERVGHPVCVHRVPDDAVFGEISLPAAAVDQLRATKYLVPADDAAALPPLFVDVNHYRLHYDMLVDAFGDDFPGLGQDDYLRMVLDPDDRTYFAGNLALYLDARGGGTFFGFTVWDDATDPDATVTYDDVLSVWEQLQPRFEAGALVWVPGSGHQAAAAEGWEDPAFPIRGRDSGVTYEPYTRGVGYGTLRFYPLSALPEATARAEFGFQDLLVLDGAPLDIERVVSGVVTGERQAELSHLNVRSAARGTPNCFIDDPFDALAAWEGQLVRLECGESRWSVEAATLSEAEAWWEALRPEPLEIPAPDPEVRGMPGLLEVPTDTPAQRATAVATWGSKGANLAALYQRVPAEVQLEGFVVPFAWYLDFEQTRGWTVDLGDGAAWHSFAETLDAWHQDPAFLGDAVLRRERLGQLRAAMKDAPVDPALLDALAAAIRATWGGDLTTVRFRSSSNAEDGLAFSGAGLYDSTSACLADQLDGDDAGPSLCDPDEDDERTLERAVRRVWASLWKVQAWEERAWYGIDQRQAAMAVLVNTRSDDEQANVVAFTGDPDSDDDRFVVNAQVGDYDVVAAVSGVYPEKDLLTLDAGGAVVAVDRVRGSSELPEGEWVLDRATLDALGGLLWQIERDFPVDEQPPEGREVLIDTEWKVLADGRLIIKQVRPFLR